MREYWVTTHHTVVTNTLTTNRQLGERGGGEGREGEREREGRDEGGKGRRKGEKKEYKVSSTLLDSTNSRQLKCLSKAMDKYSLSCEVY